ncbi:MAG: hypothetical protein R3F20_10815 [Planctomycetota bacterium]
MGTGGACFRRPVDRDLEVDTVYLGAWRTETLRAAGGFDESLPRNQDDELAARLRARAGASSSARSPLDLRRAGAARGADRAVLPLRTREAPRARSQRGLATRAPPRAAAVHAGDDRAPRGPRARRDAAGGLFALGGLLALHALATLALTPGPLADRARAVPLALGLHLGYGLGFLSGLLPRRTTA